MFKAKNEIRSKITLLKDKKAGFVHFLCLPIYFFVQGNVEKIERPQEKNFKIDFFFRWLPKPISGERLSTFLKQFLLQFETKVTFISVLRQGFTFSKYLSFLSSKVF